MTEFSIPDLPDSNPFQSENRCCALINNVKIGIFRNTPGSGRCILANPSMLRIFGYDSMAEFMQIEVIDLYRDPEHRNSIIEEVRRNGSVRNREIPMKKRDGTPIWCSLTITAEYDEAGEIKWMDGVVEEITWRRKIQEAQQNAIDELETRVRDRLTDLVDTNELLTTEIAERKRIEERLRENNQFLEVLINAIPNPFFYKDAKGIYRGCNRAFEQLFGRSRDQIIGKTDFDIVPEELADRCRDLDQKLFEDPHIMDYETTILDAANKQRQVIINKAAYPKNGDKYGGVIGIIIDVTELRKYEEERIKIEKLESLGVLAGGIAHDFNNIITGIMGNISLARMFLEASHKSVKPLNAAEKASQRAAELAHQLLTFARGGGPVKKTIRLQHILKEGVSCILRGSNVQGVVDIPETLHSVKADEGQISQAFSNIVLNGMQSMPDGGTLKIRGENVMLGIRNRLALPPGNYVKIDFMDKGCGISVENRKKIFDPYFTTKEKGTGLGLSSTYSIIVRHGGYIGVHSVVGGGTTFSCYLPSTGEIVPEEEIDSEVVNADAPMGDAVLVMDDEEMIRDITAEILDHLGYKATTCSRGEEVIRIYREAWESGNPFFAVIMDLTIPGGMGGKEAARKILEFDPDACLIV